MILSDKYIRAKPLHDFSSHAADSMRYMCVALPKITNKSSPEELDKRYREAMYGETTNMPSVFRTDLPEY
jgi:hypothetical protein